MSQPIGPWEITAAYLGGKMGAGSYRKVALEGSAEIASEKAMPLTIIFSIEDRYFNFGKGGSESEPKDEFIFVTGFEFHFEKML